MQFKSFFLSAAAIIVAAAGVQGGAVPSFVPTATVTKTETFTATRIFHTLVPTPPYLIDVTTLTSWTETETDTLYATYPAA